MLKRFMMATAAAAVTLGAITSAAHAGSADSMVGTWTNTDSNTRGITKLVISQEGGQYKIQAFGQCHPTDCDWGNSNLITYGDSVQDVSHSYGTAIYNPGFANTAINLQQSGNQITVNSFTQFTDNSGRQNYHGRYSFRKTPILVVPRIPRLPVLPRT